MPSLVSFNGLKNYNFTPEGKFSESLADSSELCYTDRKWSIISDACVHFAEGDHINWI